MKLARLGRERLGKEQAEVKAKQAEVLAAGAARAQAVNESVDSRVEQAKLDSDLWYFTGSIERSGSISRRQYNAILSEARREEQSQIQKAKSEARKIKAPQVDDTTEGLRSQIVASASHSKIKLSPQDTNIYIRNYKAKHQ